MTATPSAPDDVAREAGPALAARRAPAEAARLALACLDLTALSGDEDEATLDALADRAAHPAGRPAALCVLPRHLAAMRARLVDRGLGALPLATVVAFPHGDASPQRIRGEVSAAVDAGADEIDLVVPWRALKAAAQGIALQGLDTDAAEAAVTAAVMAARSAAGPRTLKAIIESGELDDPRLVALAARRVLAAGADFVKTSTGRASVHATPAGVAAILHEISAHAAAGGGVRGLKVSGGLRSVADVQGYLAQVEAVLGPAALEPGRLRFGASSLWAALVAAIEAGNGGEGEPIGAASAASDAEAVPADLLAAARAARERAYAPYSRFRVGAAVRWADGRVTSGANVENASYGLTLCAERAALVAAIAAGAPPRGFRQLAVIGDTDGPIAPCGACRQVMLELGGPSMAVWLADLAGSLRRTTVGELLPHAFQADDLA